MPVPCSSLHLNTIVFPAAASSQVGGGDGDLADRLHDAENISTDVGFSPRVARLRGFRQTFSLFPLLNWALNFWAPSFTITSYSWTANTDDPEFCFFCRHHHNLCFFLPSAAADSHNLQQQLLLTSSSILVQERTACLSSGQIKMKTSFNQLPLLAGLPTYLIFTSSSRYSPLLPKQQEKVSIPPH